MPGGKTPIPFFKQIADNKLDWSNTSILLSDERMVPLSDMKSNYGMVKTHFIDQLNCNFLPFIVQYNDQLEKIDNYLSGMGFPNISVLQ